MLREPRVKLIMIVFLIQHDGKLRKHGPSNEGQQKGSLCLFKAKH